MRVLVTGAHGLIGSACLARLHRDGHDLVASGRANRTARRCFPYADWVKADFSKLTKVTAWRDILIGIDAVVNCVGALQDGSRDNLQRVQVEATAALFSACERLGIRRVVHVSAIGVDATGRTAFARTKAAAEAHLQSLDLDWLILRPALVLSSAVYGGTAILRGLCGIPLVTPLVGAESRVQVVASDDVAETVARALAPGAPAKVTWEVAHPQVHTLGDVATAVRRWLGFPPRMQIPLPRFAGWALAFVANMLGWLGWRSPARTTALLQLKAGVVGDPAPWSSASGIVPQSLDTILAARPSTVQDRWHAHLYWLKPLAIAVLAGVWIVHGLSWLSIALGTKNGLLSVVPASYLAASALLALVLGIGIIVRPTTRLALLGMALFPVLHVFLYGRYLPAHALDLSADAIAYALPPLFVLAVLEER